MMVRAWMTGTAVTWSDDESGDYTDEHGWIDTTWSRHELFDSRNDVRPVATYDTEDPDAREDYPTLNDWIRATVAEYLGAAEDNGDGTWYAADSHEVCDFCLTDEAGRSFSFALHFDTKGYDGRRGWHEDPVTLTDNGA